MSQHIIVIGAGPAGLAFARAYQCGAGRGGAGRNAARITIVERQSRDAIAAPAPDGREIALTGQSVRMLGDLGVWPMILAEEAWPLQGARVLDGGSSFVMAIDAHRGRAADGGTLGMMVSNHIIRRALHDALGLENGQDKGIDLVCDATVTGIERNDSGVTVRLDGGETLSGDMVIAADSRFSTARAMLGIGVDMLPTGKSMLLARVEHEADHGGLASEWFDYGQTIAMLPLAPKMSSFVLTVPHAAAQHIASLGSEALGAIITERTHGRWGQCQARTPAHVYPLTMTYSHHFSGQRAALIGDAAVGMHPVTAHGFNFGLMGAVRLARAMQRSGDVARGAMLRSWAIRHRAATLPLYIATRSLVGLYTDEHVAARLTRRAVLRLGGTAPVRGALSRLLSANAG
ncbi:MAG: FAD-dependent monooxygenase [Sphingomonadales bacterium]|jgi:ubiquinone biosynthesis UbiH/UbiF/VisC/COQ6 family hydroxylase|nr:FAD-dependent monooxygenase [Sphingomonadales bacterium]MBK9002954.1 FAD-dependent monooxygenase [Sphingomonadales bacterium]MBK9268202.1 FAD-dependent monooxygenase [Sphingomonadales bacterium]